MKLYTEEQVLRMLEVCRDSDLYEHILTFEDILKTETPIELPSDSLCINCDESKSTHNVCIDCMIKIGKENIKLPSDEEIRNEAWEHQVLSGEGDSKFIHFSNGAKWMREKIQELKKL